MKLYIDSILSRDFKDINGALEEISETLEKFSIKNHIEKRADNFYNLKIFDQKVTLDEISMNTLFDTLLNSFDFTMEYGYYGGEGCEFSIKIFPEYER